MAQKEIVMGEMSGGLLETTLWENTNPSSAYAGSSSPISLISGNFSDYKYIRFDFKVSTTATDVLSVLTDIDSWVKTTSPALTSIIVPVGSVGYIRIIRYSSDTTFIITPTYAVNTSGTNNNLAIPIKVVGLK